MTVAAKGAVITRRTRIVVLVICVAALVLNGTLLYPFLRSTKAQQQECLAIITGTGGYEAKDQAIQHLWRLTRMGDPVCDDIAGNLARIMDERERVGTNYGHEFGVVLWSLKILEESSLDRKHAEVVERVEKFRPQKEDGDVACRLLQSHALLARSGIILRYAQRTLERAQQSVLAPAP